MIDYERWILPILTIKPLTKDEREKSEYKYIFQGKTNKNSHIIKHNDDIIAYTSFKMKSETIMWLDMIEVTTKQKGFGTKIIDFLFKNFSLEKMEGFILCEERAYRFWHKLGAEIYYMDYEGYQIEELIDAQLESPFLLVAN